MALDVDVDNGENDKKRQNPMRQRSASPIYGISDENGKGNGENMVENGENDKKRQNPMRQRSAAEIQAPAPARPSTTVRTSLECTHPSLSLYHNSVSISFHTFHSCDNVSQ